MAYKPKHNLCLGCGTSGVVSWSSKYASDKDGRFSMSGEVLSDPRISVCILCHGIGWREE